MLKVKVLTIGRSKETWLMEGLGEYEKRLKGKLQIEWKMAKDEEQLSDWVSGERFIALDPKGTLMTSEDWSEKISHLGSRFNFVIGGAEGLTSEILKKATYLWSLSPLTFTHQMTRLILVEQLYRALEIERGSEYHK